MMLVIAAMILGVCFGSFANVVILRRLKYESLGGRSKCPVCNHKIEWFDNIPVISFLLLKGRCRHCKTAISFQYPFIEILMMLVWGMIAHYHALSATTITYWVISFLLIVIATMDFLEEAVDDCFVILGVIAVLIHAYFFGDILTSIIGGLLAATMGILIYFIARVIYKKEQTFGGGDTTVGILVAMLVGAHNYLLIIALAIVILNLQTYLVPQKKRYYDNHQTWSKTIAPFVPSIVIAVAIHGIIPGGLWNTYKALILMLH